MPSTHINSACFFASDEEVILATLFRQGTVIAIDRKSGQSHRVVSGLRAPHDLRPLAGNGWIISDTANNQTLIFNEHWQITRRLHMDFNWVQSSAPLSDSSIVIADTNHHRLVRVYLGDPQPRYEVRNFPTEWRIYLVEEVPEEHVNFFRHPIAHPFL
jgi:hypothetical protein